MLHLGLNKSNISKKKKDNSKLSKESKKTLLFNKSITQISLYIHLFTLKKIFKKNFLIFKNLQNYVKVRNNISLIKNKILIFPGVVIGPIEYTYKFPISFSSFKISKNVKNYIIKNGGKFVELGDKFIYKEDLKNLILIKKL